MAFLSRRIAASFLAAATALAGFPVATSAAPATKEYQVKAVFLFNFAQFVEWPPDAFPEASAPLVIGVLGGDPFGPVLDEVVANETVHHHPVIVRHFPEAGDISVCHVLFIAESDPFRLTHILKELEGRPILTVGDAKSFAASKGMIQFVLAENRIRLRINASAAKAARLSISSQLLRQAEVVETTR
jgi:hypothetical protein